MNTGRLCLDRSLHLNEYSSLSLYGEFISFFRRIGFVLQLLFFRFLSIRFIQTSCFAFCMHNTVQKKKPKSFYLMAQLVILYTAEKTGYKCYFTILIPKLICIHPDGNSKKEKKSLAIEETE